MGLPSDNKWKQIKNWTSFFRLFPLTNNNMGNLTSNKIFPKDYVQPFILSMNQIFAHVVLTNFTDPLDIG